MSLEKVGTEHPYKLNIEPWEDNCAYCLEKRITIGFRHATIGNEIEYHRICTPCKESLRMVLMIKILEPLKNA